MTENNNKFFVTTFWVFWGLCKYLAPLDASGEIKIQCQKSNEGFLKRNKK